MGNRNGSVTQEEFVEENKAQTQGNLTFHRLCDSSIQRLRPARFLVQIKVSAQDSLGIVNILERKSGLGWWTGRISDNFQRFLPLDIRVFGSARGTNKLDRSSLHDKCSELFECEIVVKGSQEESERGHVKVAVTKSGSSLVEGEDVLGVIIGKQIVRIGHVKPKVGPLSEYLLHLPIDCFDNSLLLLSRHALGLFLDSFFHLLSIFCLLTYGNLVACQNERLNIFLQVTLVKADNLLHLARWNAQIDQFVANGGILEVNDEPVTESVEHNLVKVFALYLPIAHHTRSQHVLFGLWNVHSGRVVVGVVRASLLIIHEMLFLSPPRTFFVRLDN